MQGFELPRFTGQNLHMPKALSSFLIIALALAACTVPDVPHKPATQPASAPTVFVDFEQPDPAVVWVPEGAAATPTTVPATQAWPLQRTSHLPQGGLWSLGTSLTQAGEIRYLSGKPLDLSAHDLLTAQVMHADTPAHNGQSTAALVVTDAAGKTVRGDAYPVLSHWQSVTFDLRIAQEQGLDTSRIATIGLALCPVRELPADSPLAIQTDSWSTLDAARSYLGTSVGPAKSFYVEYRGTRLVVGTVGQYEITLLDRGARPSAVGKATPAPTWLTIATPARKVLGQPATGLMLLDQSGLDTLGALRRQDPDNSPQPTPPPVGLIPDSGWPASLAPGLAAIHWSVVWTSPVAALVEGIQENGPYDRLGMPAVTIKWQLMIFQWGQVFVHASWAKSRDMAVAEPITWALVTDDVRPLTADTGPADRLLADIYTPVFRNNLHTALPHEMQAMAPVALIARTTAQKDTFWRAVGVTAEGLHRHIFGAAIPPQREEEAGQNPSADCMLLVNNPDPLTKAATFSQYLDPPKIVVRQGEIDTTFPGDTDRDGFVETYGFQVVRLANGRATFTIYPQKRPIFYPPILFTVPAVEREALDVKHSKLLINIDGKQFANPPQFPDGSYLLQIPYVLDGDRPVSVEAILVR